MDNIRFKHVLKMVNNTGNPKWGHYEKHWKLQVKDNDNWKDVEDVYFVESEDGSLEEISFNEYKEKMKNN